MKISLFKFLTLSILLSISFSTNAQRISCTTHEMTNAILEQEPEKRALIEQLNREAEAYTSEHYGERIGGVKVIPTVIHVIHDNGSENLSKTAILNALEVVNEELIGQNGNLSSIVSPFSSIIGNPGFELRLAKIDVDGNCTDGITRTVSDQTYSADEDVKNLVNWNTGSRRYLQVWLVNTVGSGAGGYTYLPGAVNATRNGIILRSAQLTSSLSHEFGHWLNLSHVWGGSNDNGAAGNCSDDDGVNDTPNCIGTTSGCNTNQMTCGSVDNVQNHMDYSSCGRMFTLGQAARMQSASNSTTTGRSTYWGNSNRSATGTSDGFTNTCVPTIDFYVGTDNGCEGVVIEFDDNSWGADEDPSWVWNWSFPGGTPSTSNDPNPTVTYNTAGEYDVTLSITTAAGTNSETVQNAVFIENYGGGLTGPVVEGMENSSFPNNSDPSMAWEVESAGGLTWQRTNSVSFTGDASARINLRNITSGDVNSLISPPIDMSSVSSSDAEMTFRLAHANRNSTDHDERLRVYVSKNCGESWSLRYTKDGDNLNTAGGLISGIFTPDAGDWREESVSLGTMAGEEHVLIKFETTSDRQSYLYIDDININPNAAGTGINESGVISGTKVFPNPTDGSSQLQISLKKSIAADITIMNVLGETISNNRKSLNSGINLIRLSELTSELASGLYVIQISSEQGVASTRFVMH